MAFDTKQKSFIAFRDIISERTSRVAAWVGSGLSTPAGLPTWPQLKNELQLELKNKINSIDEKDRKKLSHSLRDIEKESNYWLAFQRLKDDLGRTTYNETIRNIFQATSTAPIPCYYTLLWKLKISGLLNLNIDRFATKARKGLVTASNEIEFNGKNISEYLHVLKQPHPFIVNLHGILEDTTTWVFTKNELNRLFKNPGYSKFVTSCLASYTILFIGITADDFAVGGHLEELAKQKINSGTHFWVTDRTDLQTDRWAENNNIRIIRYSAINGNHSELNDFFENIINYVPKDVIAPPVLPGTIEKNNGNGSSILSPEEIIKLDTNKIRMILNIKAKELLENSNGKFGEYEEFCKLYDEAIYRAWYTSDENGKNNLLAYKLQEFKSRGAFGRVFLAKDKNNNDVAIKVLKEEERKKTDFLQSFRRGVRSMRILAERHVEGMVAYKEAYEIPAFVVMEWINGPNLNEAVRAKQLKSWDDILRVVTELTNIISNAHHIPERVLHRDLRPANIMLENYYTSADWKVKILDFDLSWHIGASEKSVLNDTTTTGYLAPEQLQTIRGISTRNAAVDSFGLGMTLFFILTERDPIQSEHKHKDWETTIYDAARQNSCKDWKSLPTRFTRLIFYATKHNQSERWDMGQIKAELDRLYDTLLNPLKIESSELLAEEIIARTNYDYSWECDKLAANIDFPSGANIQLIGNESNKNIELKIIWTDKGISSAKNVSKWLHDVYPKVISIAELSGWKTTLKSCKERTLRINGEIHVTQARQNIKKYSNSIIKICNSLQFK
ncbi:MAG: protein kinase [Ignavibacteria bacterium]|jgi:serine/threonine protein kinase|nr:protein kinase [Ignavibacteria bacterium]MCU7522285.1 protein kinase [Ignavibacteria bacterium]